MGVEGVAESTKEAGVSFRAHELLQDLAVPQGPSCVLHLQGLYFRGYGACWGSTGAKQVTLQPSLGVHRVFP